MKIIESQNIRKIESNTKYKNCRINIKDKIKKLENCELEECVLQGKELSIQLLINCRFQNTTIPRLSLWYVEDSQFDQCEINRLKALNVLSFDNCQIGAVDNYGFDYLREATYTCAEYQYMVKEYRHQHTNMEFIHIPGGTFHMAENYEVTLSPYLIGKYAVNQAQWQSVMNNNPSSVEGDKYPVDQASWEDCVEFCEKAGLHFPTEAQWEYACRAGSMDDYCFGNDQAKLGEYAWYEENSEQKLHPVGGKKNNAFGIYDMHGNVSEWCRDRLGKYPSGKFTDPGGYSSGNLRIHRSGSYRCGAYSNNSHCRMWSPPDFTNGLRCVSVFEECSVRGEEWDISKCSIEVKILDMENSENNYLDDIVNSGFDYLGQTTYMCANHSYEVKEYQHKKTQMDFVYIPGGSFYISGYCKVNLSPYLIGKYPVTQKQWKLIMETTPSKFEGEQFPVECVSWDDCLEFCQKTNLYLPTDAQWEYACRGGSMQNFCFGSNQAMLEEYAWYDKNVYEGTTHSVGQKKSNAFGLFDMHGNVCEWCLDLDGSYPTGEYIDLKISSVINNPDTRSTRGGSWNDRPRDCYSNFRYMSYSNDRDYRIGFRCAIRCKDLLRC